MPLLYGKYLVAHVLNMWEPNDSVLGNFPKKETDSGVSLIFLNNTLRLKDYAIIILSRVA